MDLGCGEGKFLRFVKEEPFVSRIVGVDIHRPSLDKATAALRPLNADYLMPRAQPLSIELFEGSLVGINLRALGKFDAAVCIEV